MNWQGAHRCAKGHDARAFRPPCVMYAVTPRLLFAYERALIYYPFFLCVCVCVMCFCSFVVFRTSTRPLKFRCTRRRPATCTFTTTSRSRRCPCAWPGWTCPRERPRCPGWREARTRDTRSGTPAFAVSLFLSSLSLSHFCLVLSERSLASRPIASPN